HSIPATELRPANAHRRVAHQVGAATIWDHSHTLRIGSPRTSTTTVFTTPEMTSSASTNGISAARMRPRFDQGIHAAIFFTRFSVLSAALLTWSRCCEACARRLATVV